MAKRNTHHLHISLATLFSLSSALLLSACTDEGEETQTEDQAQEQELVYELVPGDYPYLVGEDTICAIWEADLGDSVVRRTEFYILGRMNDELAEDSDWREYYGRDEVKTCDEAREYQERRLAYDLEHLPPTDSTIGGQYPEEPPSVVEDDVEKIGEPPGGVNNNADIDPVVHLKADPNGSYPVSYTHLTLPTNSRV